MSDGIVMPDYSDQIAVYARQAAKARNKHEEAAALSKIKQLDLFAYEGARQALVANRSDVAAVTLGVYREAYNRMIAYRRSRGWRTYGSTADKAAGRPL